MESGIIIPLLRSDQAISLALPPHTHCTSAIFCRFARLQALGQVVRIGYRLCHLSGLDAVSDNVLLIHHVPQLFHYTGTRSHSHGAQHRVSGQQVLLPLPVSVNQSPIRHGSAGSSGDGGDILVQLLSQRHAVEHIHIGCQRIPHLYDGDLFPLHAQVNTGFATH